MKKATLGLLGAAAMVAGALGACGGGGEHETGGSAGAPSAASTGGGPGTGGSASDSGGGGATSTTNAGGGGSGGAAPATCNGYEPCGVHPVVAPDGYTLLAGITVSDLVHDRSCSEFAECPMWNTHFDHDWSDVDNGWSRMGSPFPWELSRYWFVVPPKRVTYAKLRMTSANEKYVYGDGTPEMHTNPDTHVSTCYGRGTGHLTRGTLGSMGGTGNLGRVTFTISVLPGDMGNSGNASTCQGNGNSTLAITSDEATAATKGPQGKFVYCLLREGHEYYVNLMSSGMTPSTDCATAACSMGGFAFQNPTTSDGSAFRVEVPCP